MSTVGYGLDWDRKLPLEVLDMFGEFGVRDTQRVGLMKMELGLLAWKSGVFKLING